MLGGKESGKRGAEGGRRRNKRRRKWFVPELNSKYLLICGYN
jgi:hypothetical protein